MKKKLNSAIIVIYIFLSLFVVTAGLYMCSALPDAVMTSLNKVLKTDDLPLSGNEIIGDMLLSNEPEKVSAPDDMHGMWFDIDFDLTVDASAASVINEIESYFIYFKNFYTDTLFIKPDTDGKFVSLSDSAGNSIDIMREITSRARANGYTVILAADEKLIADANAKFVFDSVKYYLSNYEFDGVIITSSAYTEQNKMYDALVFFKDKMQKYFPLKLLGCEVFSDTAPNYADEGTINILNSALTDFIYLEADTSTTSSQKPFGNMIAWWNSLAAQYKNVAFYCEHRADLVGTSAAGFSSHSQITEQLRLMWDCENFKGSSFFSAYYMKKNTLSFAQRVAYHYSDGEYSDLTVQRISLDSDNNTVTFYGTAASGHKLYLNGEVTDENGGSFSQKYSLSAGLNNFNFFSCGKDINYGIINNSHLIYSYYPQTDINAAKGDVFTIYAVCMNNATVKATLNGYAYDLLPTDAVVLDTMPEGYSVFSCGITFSGDSYMDVNLGNIVITAELGGATESVTCGRVTLLKSNSSKFVNSILEFFYSTFFRDSVKDPVTDQTAQIIDVVSPFKDNGLGTSLMCRIKYDNTEVLGTVSDYDTYHADYSTLPVGTLDYVDRMTVSEEGYIRYELRSGLSVYGVNCELINNAYTLPDNKIIVNRVDESSATSTDIVFDVDWLSPVTVKAYPQSYSKGYLDYSFNVSSFTAEYVDVKFYYAKEFYNTALLNFAADSVFSRSELYSEDDNTLILRLYLRRAGQFYGFNMFRNENNQFVLSFKKHSDGSLAGKTVMLDPGHGGLSMTGTALSDNSVAEENVTLAVALKAKQLLESKGATVLLTRTASMPLTLSERSKILCASNPDIFVSIHCDGSDNTSDSGTHTFYFRPYSQPLANAINENLVHNYRTYIYSPGDTNYSKINKGIKYYPFYVTRMDECPSVLVETGFMTNAVEGAILTNDNYQYWIADGISNGIEQYFAQNY